MKTSTRQLWHSAAAIVGAMLLSACGGSSSNSTVAPPAEPAPASVRVVHASPDAPAVDLQLNGTVTVQNLDYAQATDAIEAFNIAKDKTRSTKVQLVCA